mmetsp:Transcript_42755/g.56447  ORF Transcript_42755/g.56447 Transcript_42755/m.56447 type:complete len:168 (+) Transcript_42755:265-768(+)
MAIPQHMDDNQKIIIGQRRGSRAARDSDKLKREESSIFMEKMASIIGPSYVLALFGGGFYGLTLPTPPKARRTTRILLNTYLNNVGKTSSRFANNTAAAVLLYVITGKFINFIFLEELEDMQFNQTMQNALYGGVAGALYKCTRGVRPMMLSTVIGATIGSCYSYAW